ncbi:MAG: cellulase family glycosylhydrolase [Candidatus Anstonellales archaeon]
MNSNFTVLFFGMIGLLVIYSNATVPNYFVNGTEVYVQYPNGTIQHLKLYGVNWFGFETPDRVVHGLWSRNYRDMLDQIKSLGFNAIRLPFCRASIRQGGLPTTIDYSKNLDLVGLSPLQIMKKIVAEAEARGIYVLLDYHRIGCNYIEPLWYTQDYPESDFIQTWRIVAREFKNFSNVIGADLKNEPHSNGNAPYTTGSTWGYNPTTDWNLAAERIGNAILQEAPHWLIFVEGTYATNPTTDSSYQYGLNAWWGGNLMAVRDYPVNLPANKLVYSPHVYGPDVYQQPYFSDPNFPNNLPQIWYRHFGYVKDELGKPVIIGEFGGKYGEHDPNDIIWQKAIVDWMILNDYCSFFYWSWNPNSGDTGGILADDWNSVKIAKYNNLKRLMDYCSGLVSKQDALAGVISNTTPSNTTSSQSSNTTNNTTAPSQPSGSDCSGILISYPQERWPSAYIDSDGNGRYDFVMEVNPWNIQSSRGYARMCYENGVIRYEQDLNDIVLISPGSWVHGYPEIFVGNKPWNGMLADELNVFPKRMSEFPDMTVNLTYSIYTDGPINLAFETWITNTYRPTSGVASGDVEVMIWFYYNGLNPAGSKIGDVVVPVYMNGVLTNMEFEVWRGYIGWEYIAFRSKTPMLAATVSFNLKTFLDLTYQYSTKSRTQLDAMYVQNIEVGTEYGSPSTTAQKLFYNFSKFSVELGSTLPSLNNSSDDSNTTPPSNNNSSGSNNSSNNSSNNNSSSGESNGNVTPPIYQSLPNTARITSDWGSGFCAEVTVTNNLNTPVYWSTYVELAMPFTINNAWNANPTPSGSGYEFTGAHWNNLLNPGQSTSFGFCGSWNTDSVSATEVSYTLTITSDWGSGFCAKVDVHNQHSQRVTWQVTIPRSNYGIATINSNWNSELVSSGSNLVFRGASWNNVLAPGASTSFGFCASR